MVILVWKIVWVIEGTVFLMSSENDVPILIKGVFGVNNEYTV